MVRYNCENDGPRPESYFEDYELVQMHTSNENEKRQMYWELKTGAETGWDYSSRYFFLLINIFKKLLEFICNLGRKYYQIIF
jgi:alpha,alpha-trehalase